MVFQVASKNISRFVGFGQAFRVVDSLSNPDAEVVANLVSSFGQVTGVNGNPQIEAPNTQPVVNSGSIVVPAVISQKNTGDMLSDLSDILNVIANVINIYISLNYPVGDFLDPSLILTLAENLYNNNYTKSIVEEGNKVITQYIIPFLKNNETIITTYFDKLSNTLFYEIPAEFHNFISDKVSVALIKDLDNSVIGKFLLTLPSIDNIKSIVPFTFTSKPRNDNTVKADVSVARFWVDGATDASVTQVLGDGQQIGFIRNQINDGISAGGLGSAGVKRLYQLFGTGTEALPNTGSELAQVLGQAVLESGLSDPAAVEPALVDGALEEQGVWTQQAVLVEDPTNPLSLYKEFYATSPYADVYFKANSYIMFIKVIYKDLKGLSAFHIHVNNNGSPGPILAWLGTTVEWQNGVAQNGQNSNSPCCTIQNPNCSLISPPGTPYLKSIEVPFTKKFVVYNEHVKCNSDSTCPWINNGTLLDFHGPNFQQEYDGKLTPGVPGADMIFQATFEEVNVIEGEAAIIISCCDKCNTTNQNFTATCNSNTCNCCITNIYTGGEQCRTI
jgi:hypothetical protein